VAGRIRSEDVALVRERTRLDEVVGEHVTLKSAGSGSLKGLCPFHDERSPSFTVRPAVGMYHCLAGETGVLTDEGVVPIRELAGRTVRILARTHGMRSASWVEAPFRSFGVQALMKVSLSRDGRTKEVCATDGHRWFVTAGARRAGWEERLTRDLVPGDRLVSNYPANRVQAVTPSPSGTARGITYGDGSRRDGGSSTDELPDLEESTSYLYGWLAGCFAADGCVADDGDTTLASADRKALEHVERLCTRIGVATNGITTQYRKGYGTTDSAIHSIRFMTSDLTESFFLLGDHRERFLAAEGEHEQRHWVVTGVEPTDRVEEVFCAVVEGARNFTLEGNILTGNCFGCGESGDAYSFLQKVDGVTFVEAVERLAVAAGVTLRYEDGGAPRSPQDVGRRQRLLDAHRVAAEYYAEQLFSPGAEVGRRFLKERGFDRVAAKQFGVGFAPAGWDSLVKHLRAKGFTDDEVVTGGLASRSQRAARGPYDRFRGRLVWPIRDTTGLTIGFGARRLLDDDDGPKYLNTPETPLYKKSSVLYGLDLAKKEVARAKQVVVVEGYTDVMACHLAGVGTAVATCGTAFGGEHVAVVRRFIADDDVRSGEVVFTFDGDEAGQKAALRAFEEDQRFVAQTYIAVQPDGMDPCELRQARGDQAVRDLVAGRRPLFEFAIRSRLARYDLDTAEGRVAALRVTAPVVAAIRDRSLRPEYGRQLAGWLGMDVEPVRRAVAAAPARSQGAGHEPPAGRAQRGDTPPAVRPPALPDDPVSRAERQLLQVLLQHPGLAPPAVDDLDGEVFAVPVHRAVHDVVRALGGMAEARGDQAGWAERVREAAGEGLGPLVQRLAVAPLPVDGEEATRRLAEGLLRGVRERDLLRREADLRGRAQRLEGSGDAAATAQAYRELFELTAARRALQGE
jgi:DNA primase